MVGVETSGSIPIWEILDYQGRSVTWLAQATGFPRWKVNFFKMGRLDAPPEFREKAARLLGVPEDRLFFGPECLFHETIHANAEPGTSPTIEVA